MSEGGQGGSNADSSSAIRVVPDFDALKLTRFLQGKLEGVQGSLVVEQFARGTTHLTHLLRAGEREYVLRRPLPFAREDGEASLLLEWRVLSALSSVWRRVPRALLVCEDPAVLGAPFYVMERVRGVILRARVRSGMELGPERMRRAAEAAVDTLAELHGIDAKAIGLDALDAGAGTLEADVAAWAARCARAQAVPLPAFAALAEWLPRHRPPPGGSVVIHNDWAYDNLVLDPVSLSRVVAVLDWERAGMGDPLLDLGALLGHWVQADDPPILRALQRGPTALPGNLTRAQILDRYEKKAGREVSHVVFHYVFALFRRAVARLEAAAGAPAALEEARRVASVALDAVNKGRIDRLKES